MVQIYFIRHGQAAQGFDGARDPGLSPQGYEQAKARATDIARSLPPETPILTSPLKRCRETAAPLAKLWASEPQVESRIAEIPSPDISLAARAAWLKGIMQGGWNTLDAQNTAYDYKQWRQSLIDSLHEWANKAEHVIMFSHFIAINVAYGVATNELDNVVLFRPANASLTIFNADGANLHLAQKGTEIDDDVAAETRIL